jgi:RNA polymerase sigma factor (sigma-70 family)
MKGSAYDLKTPSVDTRSHETEGLPAMALTHNAPHRDALRQGCGIGLRDGYGDAYTQGFERTARFLLSRGASPGHAEELAQAAWVRGWECLHQLRGDSSVGTWVNVIALNLFRNDLRREKYLQPLIETQSSFRMDIAAIDAVRILNSCRPGERALLEHQLIGATVEEIAQVTGVTRTAIRIRLLRLRRAVRARLEQRATRLREYVDKGKLKRRRS